MTTNEKIQFYRKRLGLSQEELGQKLLVSRQTVSLWENGQTAPTIDNLIRLKEIFGVSVDELLGCETASELELSPNESYKSGFVKEEFAEIYKSTISRTFTFQLKVILALIFFLLECLWLDINDVVLGIVSGVLGIYILQSVITYYQTKKAWKAEVIKSEQCQFEYNVYDDHFIVNIVRDDETILSEMVKFSDIKKSVDTGKRLILTTNTRVFALDKACLMSNSAFYRIVHDSSGSAKIVSNKLSFAADFFFVMSIVLGVALFGALGLDSWFLFLGLPIPIFCTVLGFVIKKRGANGFKNIFVGLLCTLILLCGGLRVLLIGYTPADFDAFEYVCEATGISFPERISQNTFNNDADEYGEDDVGFIYSVTEAVFEEPSADFFENDIAYDPRWVTTVDEKLNGLVSMVENYNPNTSADRILVYNEYLPGYNIMPEEEGTYFFYVLLYYENINSLEIFECAYDVN